MKTGFLQKLIERLDRVEPEEVQNYLLRLLQEKGFLERVFDALQEGVVVLDPGGTITYVNRAACRLFGLSQEEALGEEVGVKIRGLEWDALARADRTVSRDLEVFYPENRYLNFYLAPIEGEEGGEQEVLGYVMIVRDLTRDRRLTEERIESERLTALTMLAAGVAHEIGNPLNSLNIHLQLARRKMAKLPAEAREAIDELLDTSLSEIKRLDFIVSQFLGAIRPHEPHLELTDVNALIEESLGFLDAELKDRRVRLELELGAALPMMPLDRDQMKQAIYNLVKNASQAIGTEGSLKISSSRDQYNVLMRFEDDGLGISAENMGNLFQPYFTTKRSGTGLGLLIVRRIVREHGGELEVESREGRGTVVTIYLPTVQKQMRFLPPAGETDAGAGAGTGPGQAVEELPKRPPKKAKGRVVEK